MVHEQRTTRKAPAALRPLIVAAIVAVVAIGGGLWANAPRAKVDRCQATYIKVIQRCRLAAERSGDLDGLVRCYNQGHDTKASCVAARRK